MNISVTKVSERSSSSCSRIRNELVKTLAPLKNKLYRYALHIVRDVAVAEDVVQEVYIKVWKNASTLSTIENQEAWCMKVTRNLSLDKLRRKKHHTDALEDHYDLADDRITPDQQLESNDTMGLIRRAIAQLPDTQRQVIHLREIEGYSYKEIAEITEFSVDKVKVNLHRARLALREKLESIYVS
ncbi:MAG: sigma-70 family RNA polymerase sigma factor [Bacteroidota bacterium]